MGRPTLPIEIIESLRGMVSRGVSIRRTAKEFRLARKTVQKYLRRKDSPREENHPVRDAGDPAPESGCDR